MNKPDVLSELDKVIEGWEYVVKHEKGTISKALMEQILKSIQLLHGYKQAKQETAREIFGEIRKRYKTFKYPLVAGTRKEDTWFIFCSDGDEWQSLEVKFIKEEK